MRNIVAICGKELKQIFSSSVAYVILAAFLMLSGFFFYDLFSNYSQILSYAGMYQQPGMMEQVNVNDMILTPLFHNMNVILLLIVPLITMRLYSEEKRAGTDELLLTSPVSVGQIVAGKLFAGLAFYLLVLLLTLTYPAIVAKYAAPDYGKVAAGYLGLLLMGTAFIAFGLFASTLSKSQVVAAVATFSVLLMFWILGWIAESQTGATSSVLRYLSMTEHFEKFGEGAMELSDLVYFLSFIGFFWFLATRSVESTRWR